ncbi:MAG: hypothetical protein KIT10_05130 [Flavobacteriales bacterium]|nr:hypothetical protein [Flavobacteriales bacterium]
MAVVVLIACRYDKPGDCPKDIICTMDFRSVGVQVTDTAGAPVVLDSTRTIHLAHGAVVLRSSGPEPFPAGSWYAVLTDNHMSFTDTKGRDFRFEGFLGGARKAQALFRIRHDCCHVDKVSGPEVIVVE